MTTLAWIVLAIFYAPLDGRRSGAYRPGGRTLAGSFCPGPMYGLRTSYARYATHRPTSTAELARSRKLERAILFREIIFRGMNVRNRPARRTSRASSSRCHRPKNPQRTAGGRANHECRVGEPRRHFGASVPPARSSAGGGRLYQGLSRTARREKARVRSHGLRDGALGEPGGNRSRRLRGIRTFAAAGTRVLDALRGNRLCAQMRGA